MIGQTISHYRITAELGSGGMGTVYRAVDTRLDRTVALKFLPPESTRDRQAKARFVAEARAASALDHPNVCTLFEIDETDAGQLFLVMACYEGETLARRIARGPLPVDLAITIARQIAGGLAKAHGQGIVHRDIKPANVFITSDGLVKILDFGLAKLPDATAVTQAGTMLGTIDYMSPEQARGETVDATTDVWALGVVIHEMLTGRRPFGRGHPQAAINAILHEEPPDLASLRPETPPALRRIVARCLARDASDRDRDAGALLVDLDALVDGSNATTVLMRTVAQRVRGPRRLVPLLAVGVVVLGVVLWRASPWRSDTRPGADEDPAAIAVLPFSYRGQEAYAYLGDGLMNLMIINLDGVEGTATMSATSVAAAIERVGPPFQRARAVEVVRELGATRFVIGEISEAGARLRVQAGLHRSDGTEILRAFAEGTVDDLFAVVDELGAQLLVDMEQSPLEHLEHAARKSTASLPALKAYLDGERHYRGFCADTEGEQRGLAEAAFAQAVAIDDSFALAWYRLATVGDFDNPYHDPSVVDALARAVALADRLPERERRLVQAAYDHRRGDFAGAEAGYRAVIESHPQDLEALSRLAHTVFTSASFRGRDWRDAVPISERFLALSPWWQEAASRGVLEIGWESRFHVAQLAVVEDDWERFDTMGLTFPWFRAQRAFGGGSADEQHDILAALAANPAGQQLLYARCFLTWPRHHDEAAERIARLMLAPDRDDATRLLGRLFLAEAGVRSGRWHLARARLDSAASIGPDLTLITRAHLATLPHVPASGDELASLHARLTTWTSPDASTDRLLDESYAGHEALVRFYLLGLLALRMDREAEALEHAARLDSLVTERDTGTAPRDLAAGIRARVARAHGEPREALRLLEAAERRVPFGLHWHNVILGQKAERQIRAQLLADLGRHEEAYRWFESLRTGMSVQLDAVSHLGAARSLRALGRDEEAVAAYDLFLQATSECETGFAPLVADARREREMIVAGR